MATKKLKRHPNFSSAEENLLLQLVEKHAAIIENKRTDVVSQEDKKKAWESIDRGFEAQIGIRRGIKNLKEKYDNLKRKARKNLGEERREVYKTGGGEYKQRYDPVTERLAALMGHSATGLDNLCDSDGYTYEVETIVEALDESMNSFTVEPVPEAVEAVEKNTTNWSSEAAEVVDKNTFANLSSEAAEAAEKNISGKWNSWSPSLLQQKKSEKLHTRKSNKGKEKLDGQQNFWQEENIRAAEKHEWARQKHDFELKCAKEKHELEMKESEMRMKLLKLKIDLEEIKLYDQ